MPESIHYATAPRVSIQPTSSRGELEEYYADLEADAALEARAIQQVEDAADARTLRALRQWLDDTITITEAISAQPEASGESIVTQTLRLVRRALTDLDTERYGLPPSSTDDGGALPW